MDDVILLSRLQFAVAVFFHFIFVPLTLGLSLLIALMETRYVRTGDEVWRKHAKFWGKLFIINFTLGVVTGITLEFQFGTNWARYSEYVADIFDAYYAMKDGSLTLDETGAGETADTTADGQDAVPETVENNDALADDTAPAEQPAV